MARTGPPRLGPYSSGHLPSLILACCLVGWMAPPASAQLIEAKPAELDGVGIDEKLSSQIPLDLRFRDEQGDEVSLRDIFSGERPVLLSLNYSDCPMLCRVQLNGLFDGLKAMEWSIGDQYDVVSVSIDPLETVEKARLSEQKYAQQYGRPGCQKGLRFLIGSQKNIAALADAVGFRFKYLPDTREYSHTAAAIVCSPQGMVSRYLYGVMYDPQTLRLSMVEASEGKVGSTLDRILLYCFHYDETKGRYGPVASQIMKLAAGFTVFALAATLSPYWILRRGGAPEALAEPVAPELPAPDPDLVASNS